MSCGKKTDHEVYCQYYYKNSSDYTIEMKVFNIQKSLLNQYNLLKNDSLLIELHGDGGVSPFQYNNSESQQGDSVVVIFSNQRYQGYKKGEGLLYEKAYQKTKVNDTKYILNFTFTNTNFDQAVIIK
jgi:hypothetical protein